MTNVFTYWEGPKPDHIDICLRSVARVCNNPGTKFHLVTPSNLGDYVPSGTLHPNFLKMPEIGTRACAIRVALLSLHGGWWWDADTIGLCSPAAFTKSKVAAASVLYMAWPRLPLRILNGYIYARCGSVLIAQWLDLINHKLEHDFEKACIWLELGEKLITPILYGQQGRDVQEVNRQLFLPVDIDSHVEQFFEPAADNWEGKLIRPDALCFGLNHSYFMYHRPKEMAPPWNSSSLIHRLLSHAEEQL